MSNSWVTRSVGQYVPRRPVRTRRYERVYLFVRRVRTKGNNPGLDVSVQFGGCHRVNRIGHRRGGILADLLVLDWFLALNRIVAFRRLTIGLDVKPVRLIGIEFNGLPICAR